MAGTFCRYLKIWVCLCLPFGCAPLSYGGEIFVFSSSHESLSQTKSADGNLDLFVNSFEPLASVTINGEAVPLADPYAAEVHQTYHLKKGINRFELEVKAGKDSKQVIYQIELLDMEAQEEEEKPFSMLTLLGLHQLDNVENVPAAEGPKKGTKFQVLVKPSYQLTQDYRLYMTLLREKISPATLSDREIVLTQLGAEFDLVGFAFDGGVSAVGTGSGSALGKVKVEDDLFIKAKRSFGSVRTGLDLTYRNLAGVPLDKQDDEDGIRMVLKTDFDAVFGGYKTNWLGSFENMDSKGRYQDRNVMGLASKVEHGLGGWVLAGQLDLKKTAYKTTNGATGEKEASLLTILEFSGTYSIKQVQGMMVVGQLRSSSQSSNVQGRRYKVTDLGVSLIYNF